MANQFITSTPRGQLEALAYQGLLAIDTHAQIHSLLAHRLSPEHAQVFAEPVPDEARQVIDWYSTAEGVKKNFTSLTPEAQSAALSRLSALLADIQNLTAELLKSGDSSQNMRGHILSLALKYPGETHVYLYGEQPVITCWGCAVASKVASGAEVSRAGAALPAATAAVAETPRSGGLLWLKILLILIILYCLAALMFGRPGCLEGWPFDFRPPGFNACPKPPEVLREIPAPSLDTEQEVELRVAEAEEKRLREEYDQLRRQLTERAEECRPEEPAPPPEPVPGETLKIPEEAAERNDLSFLDGCWICESGVTNLQTGKDVIMEFCFDVEGQGQNTVDDQDYGQCQGAVQAGFKNDKLSMKIEHMPCENGINAYSGGIMTCRDEGGEAMCLWESTDKKNSHKWTNEVPFRRK